MRKHLLQKTIWLTLCLCGFFLPTLFAQGTITGVVTNSNGEPLEGATVMVGESYGGYSDASGSYRIEDVPAGIYETVCSYIGYEDMKQTIEVVSGTERVVNFYMTAGGNTLDEIVVVGYGTMRKRDLTSSITTVKNVADNVGNSFETNLQGKAPGVQVTQSSGAAGAGAVIRIRGINSISASADPLYVVDGIPISNNVFINGNTGGQNSNPLATINPNDIESVEVLKDAAACGIYGSRGANGVIIITTKRGTQGKPTFDFTARVGVATPTKLHKFLSSQEWLQLYQEAWENDGNTGQAPLSFNTTWEEAQKTNTDWVGMTVGTGVKQEYSIGMKQGTKKFNSYLGGGLLQDESYLKGNKYERYSGRYNFDWNLAKWMKISANTSIANGINNRVAQAWDAGGFGDANSWLLPYIPADGRLGGRDPIFKRDHRKWKTFEWRAINGGTISLTPIKNLTLAATGNYDWQYFDDNIYEDTTYDITNNIAYASRNRTVTKNRNGNLTAQYNWNIGDNNSFIFLVGTEAQKSVVDGDKVKYRNADRFVYLKPLPLRGTSQMEEVEAFYEKPVETTTFLSYFGRVNYNFKNKYYVQGTLRRDASSSFGENYRWGLFPTAGVAWVVSEEGFLKESKWLSFLKFKGSWGLVGNSAIPFGQRFGTLKYSNSNPYGTGTIFYPERLANPDLRWETTRTIDGGVEIGLWQDRIQMGFEIYNKLTKDALINSSVQVSGGFKEYLQNIGSIRNNGMEFSITSHNIEKPNFTWMTIFNVARNNNKILDLGGLSADALGGGTNDTRVFIGQPVGTNYLVRWSHVDPADGRPVYLDAQGNQTKEWSTNNRVAAGKVLPDAVGGLANNFTLGKWFLDVLFTYSIGGNLYDGSAKRQFGVVGQWAMRPEIADRWREPGDIATYPRLTTKASTYGLDTEWNYNTTLFLYDATFARLRNLTLGYNFPTTPKSKIKNMRLFVVGTNLLTFTKYPGLDPEIARDFDNVQDRNFSVGVTYLTAPQQKSVSLGLNLGF